MVDKVDGGNGYQKRAWKYIYRAESHAVLGGRES